MTTLGGKPDIGRCDCNGVLEIIKRTEKGFESRCAACGSEYIHKEDD